MRRILRQIGQTLIRLSEQAGDQAYRVDPTETYQEGSVKLFASDHYQKMNQKRLEHLESLGLPLNGKSVLDLGSGPGDMAQFFVKQGCKVICVDGREDNIEQLKKQYPDLEGHVADVQMPGVLQPYGTSQIVFCYGLLYHVENPMAVIRNMADVCGEMLLLETMICDSALPIVRFDQENNTATQALSGWACRPSESFIVRSLALAGFKHVYRPNRLPDHPEFKHQRLNNLDWRRNGVPMRGVFVATRTPLQNPNLVTLL